MGLERNFRGVLSVKIYFNPLHAYSTRVTVVVFIFVFMFLVFFLLVIKFHIVESYDMVGGIQRTFHLYMSVNY